jgi:tetratricopeptide (TPR) repeat protein
MKPVNTMKGIAPMPQDPVPTIEMPEDASNERTGRIEALNEEESELTERRDIHDLEAGMADAEAALEAMDKFQNAEAAAKRGDWKKAEELAKKAVKGDPSEPNYPVLLAWIQAQNGQPQAVDDAIRKMSKLLIEDPSNEKALFYRAKLLAKTNRLRDALRDFEELLSSNPNHAEAANEAQSLRTKIG